MTWRLRGNCISVYRVRQKVAAVQTNLSGSLGDSLQELLCLNPEEHRLLPLSSASKRGYLSYEASQIQRRSVLLLGVTTRILVNSRAVTLARAWLGDMPYRGIDLWCINRLGGTILQQAFRQMRYALGIFQFGIVAISAIWLSYCAWCLIVLGLVSASLKPVSLGLTHNQEAQKGAHTPYQSRAYSPSAGLRLNHLYEKFRKRLVAVKGGLESRAYIQELGLAEQMPILNTNIALWFGKLLDRQAVLSALWIRNCIHSSKHSCVSKSGQHKWITTESESFKPSRLSISQGSKLLQATTDGTKDLQGMLWLRNRLLETHPDHDLQPTLDRPISMMQVLPVSVLGWTWRGSQLRHSESTVTVIDAFCDKDKQSARMRKSVLFLFNMVRVPLIKKGEWKDASKTAWSRSYKLQLERPWERSPSKKHKASLIQDRPEWTKIGDKKPFLATTEKSGSIQSKLWLAPKKEPMVAWGPLQALQRRSEWRRMLCLLRLTGAFKSTKAESKQSSLACLEGRTLRVLLWIRPELGATLGSRALKAHQVVAKAFGVEHSMCSVSVPCEGITSMLSALSRGIVQQLQDPIEPTIKVKQTYKRSLANSWSLPTCMPSPCNLLELKRRSLAMLASKNHTFYTRFDPILASNQSPQSLYSQSSAFSALKSTKRPVCHLDQLSPNDLAIESYNQWLNPFQAHPWAKASVRFNHTQMLDYLFSLSLQPRSRARFETSATLCVSEKPVAPVLSALLRVAAPRSNGWAKRAESIRNQTLDALLRLWKVQLVGETTANKAAEERILSCTNQISGSTKKIGARPTLVKTNKTR
uniref:hypothetical protein n=1 Tax=Streptosarcina arenaria TaxID=2058782 RepID=UPI00286AB9B4|nr:hypothetical protein RMD90_pgp070 [Streptosarcina arenaria]WKT08805.1 hypothetical protein [Streptosarcina arenaria]